MTTQYFQIRLHWVYIYRRPERICGSFLDCIDTGIFLSPHTAAKYDMTGHTIISYNLANTSYGIPSILVHLAIKTPSALLALSATNFAITLQSMHSFMTNVRYQKFEGRNERQIWSQVHNIAFCDINRQIVSNTPFVKNV